jgi:5-methylcytosine-specific restriction enzyme subunit McrC
VSTSVEVFEHETIHVGRPMRSTAGGEVRLTERHLEALARFNDAGGGRFFQIGHRKITATEHVGYVEVDGLALEILPKADRHADARSSARAWRDGLLEMLSVATGLRLETTPSAAQRTGRASLLDLVAAHFLQEVAILQHQGLTKGYREEEVNAATFRGRLVVSEQIRANAARDDRFFVRTQTYDQDTALHRILAAALEVIERASASTSIAARLAECQVSFPQVTRTRPTRQAFDRLRLGRATARYEKSLTLARMILEHAAPQLRAGRSRVFALLFDMNMLWERYVAALFRRAAGSSLEVSSQERIPFWRGGPHRRGLRPDIVIRSRADRRVLLTVDTKWKVLAGGPPGDDDLKQMFVYNEVLAGSRAALVYPSTGTEAATSGEYVGRSHRCETVHLVPVRGGRWCGREMKAQVGSLLGGLDPLHGAHPRSHGD